MTKAKLHRLHCVLKGNKVVVKRLFRPVAFSHSASSVHYISDCFVTQDMHSWKLSNISGVSVWIRFRIKCCNLVSEN